MRGRVKRLSLGVLLAALLLVSASVSFSALTPATRVVVVLAPYLTWDDVNPQRMPATSALAERALLADANVRSAVSAGSVDALTRGSLMLSTGAAVRSDSTISSFSATETVPSGGTGADLYRGIYGVPPTGAEVVYPGLPQEQATNASTLGGASLGAIGTAVRDAGGVTVAIGNSDLGYGTSAQRQRPAGVAATDERGLITLGDVSQRMLAQAPGYPFGTRTDLAAFESEYATATAAAGGRRPVLVVLDPGDLARANAWAAIATTAAADAQRVAAMRTTDAVVKMAAESLSPSDLLVVFVSAVPEPADGPPGFAPLIMYGRGVQGLAVSGATQREGIVTLMDVSASLVRAMGLKPVPGMVGSTITATSAGTPFADRLERLTRMNATSVATESVRSTVINWFIAFTVLALLASAIYIYLGAETLPPALCTTIEVGLLLSLAMPLAGLLQFVAWPWPSTGTAVLIALVLVGVVLTAAASFVGRGREASVPLVVLAGLTAITICVDQWMGAPLTFTGVFGYSPILGARYYGLGNEMAGLLLGSALVVFALVLDARRDASWAAPARRWGLPVLALVVMATSALPSFGANFGTVAWMTVGFGVAWLLLNGKRVWSWRNALLAVLIVVLLVAGLAYFDTLRSSGSETHLGRAVSSTEQGGVGAIWTIVARKAEANMRVLGGTNWTWLLVAVLLLLGYMRWRPRGEFAGMLKEYPAFSAALAACLFAGVVGNFTEDSGVIVPALIMLPVGVTAMYLMVARTRCGEGSG